MLDDTFLGLLDRFPRLASVGVVPLGLSSYSNEPTMREHTHAEAAAVLDLVEQWQVRFSDALGHRMVFAADEYYLMAGRPFPELSEYDGVPQHENGIGMARTFAMEVEAALAGTGFVEEGTGTRAGFFAWVDGAPAEGYRAPRSPDTLALRDARADAPVRIVTGIYGAEVLTPMLEGLSRRAGVPVELVPVANAFFGGNIAVTGLLSGADVSAAIAGIPADERVLLPDVVLSSDRFLDGSTVADLSRAVEVIPTDGASLVQALTPAGSR